MKTRKINNAPAGQYMFSEETVKSICKMFVPESSTINNLQEIIDSFKSAQHPVPATEEFPVVGTFEYDLKNQKETYTPNPNYPNPVPESDQGKLSIEQILNALSKVDYPAWGHGMMQMWFYNEKWRVGLRNYKTEPIGENPSSFSSVSPYAALASLYNFCVEKGHIAPNNTVPVESADTYFIYQNDKVNSILSAALKNLSTDQLEVLRDCLIQITPGTPTGPDAEVIFSNIVNSVLERPHANSKDVKNTVSFLLSKYASQFQIAFGNMKDAVRFADFIEAEIWTKGKNGNWYKIPGTPAGEKSQFTTNELYNGPYQDYLKTLTP